MASQTILDTVRSASPAQAPCVAAEVRRGVDVSSPAGVVVPGLVLLVAFLLLGLEPSTRGWMT